MKYIILFFIASVFSAVSKAQTVADKAFDTYIYNNVYNIYIKMNLYDKDIIADGQEVFGELDGFIGSDNCTQVWLITSSEIKNNNSAVIEVTNNYGSEDFTAKITVNKDGTYTLKHTGGSTLKFPVNGKWQKIPSAITFTVRKGK